jgi:predicted nucleic-acid-binding Zn-ribbon protein
VKTTKTCPSCGGREIYFRTVGARGGYGPDLLPKVGGLLRGGKFELYICGTCGFTQIYVPEKLLSAVREKYDKAW